MSNDSEEITPTELISPPIVAHGARIIGRVDQGAKRRIHPHSIDGGSATLDPPYLAWSETPDVLRRNSGTRLNEGRDGLD